jgi:D-sedoheptulose 7-phosphate isomerase
VEVELKADIQKQLVRTIEMLNGVLADESLLGTVESVAARCVAALKAGNKLLFAGNGGSAADSQHLAAEFVSRFDYDRPGLSAFALTTDTSALTAIGNDYGYDRVFSRQVEAVGRQGDVFLASPHRAARQISWPRCGPRAPVGWLRSASPAPAVERWPSFVTI